jgi:hypothetical protein
MHLVGFTRQLPNHRLGSLTYSNHQRFLPPFIPTAPFRGISITLTVNSARRAARFDQLCAHFAPPQNGAYAFSNRF